MKFEGMRLMIYCKDDYYKEFDNDNYTNQMGIEYFKGYLLHRDDGPAIDWNDVSIKSQYFLNGIRYSEEEYLKIISLKKKSRVLNEI